MEKIKTPLEKFWEGSISASVRNDYLTGNVRIIDTRKSAVKQDEK